MEEAGAVRRGSPTYLDARVPQSCSRRGSVWRRVTEGVGRTSYTQNHRSCPSRHTCTTTHPPPTNTQTPTLKTHINLYNLPRHLHTLRNSNTQPSPDTHSSTETHTKNIYMQTASCSYTQRKSWSNTPTCTHTRTYACGRVLSALWPQLPQLPAPRDPGTLLSACSSSAGSMSECATLYLGSTILGPAPGTLPSRIGFSLIGCRALGRKGSTRARSCSSPEAWGLLGRRGEGRTWNPDAWFCLPPGCPMMGEKKNPAVGGGWVLGWEERVSQSPGVSSLRAPLFFVGCQRRKNRGS